MRFTQNKAFYTLKLLSHKFGQYGSNKPYFGNKKIPHLGIGNYSTTCLSSQDPLEIFQQGKFR